MAGVFGRRTPLLLVALALVAGTGCAGTRAPLSTPNTAGLHGVEPVQLVSRPSLFLTDTSGQTYDFVARTTGRPTLLYFGYTDCPDECPTAMAYIHAALRQSPQKIREETVVVFITTDPARDSAQRLRSWLAKYSYGKQIIGLRGTPAEIERAQRLVGAPVATRTGAVPTLEGQPAQHTHAPGTPPHRHDRPLGYGVAHATDIFAYNAADRLAVLYPQSVSPADIRADLPVLANPVLAETDLAQKERA